MLPTVLWVIGAQLDTPASSGRPSLEDLAFHFGTDKSHDDHKYVDLYSALLDPIRDSARVVVEVGVALGQSLQVWHAYFTSAAIYGVEYPALDPRLLQVAKNLSRVHVKLLNSQSARVVSEYMSSLGLGTGSIDVFIDDAEHTPVGNERTLLAWWPYLKPHGLYMIEDIATGAREDAMPFYNGVVYEGAGANARRGLNPLTHNMSSLSRAARHIFEAHDSFFVDLSAGHRAWDAFTHDLGRFARSLRGRRTYARDILNHNSHVLVLRKRERPRTRPVSINIGRSAMLRVRTDELVPGAGGERSEVR